MPSDHLLGPYLDALLSRTAEANDIVRRDPREIPRRLRGLLLAIDGRNPARTYIDRLRGFGDVDALLVELISLGLVRFQFRQRGTTLEDAVQTERDMGASGAFSVSDLSPLGHLAADPAQMARTLGEATVTGPFDDLVRVRQADERRRRPASAPAEDQPVPLRTPAPPPGRALEEQVESLFGLLEQVRADRKQLRERVVAMRKYRDRARAMERQNRRLRVAVAGLALGCGALLLHAVVRAW